MMRFMTGCPGIRSTLMITGTARCRSPSLRLRGVPHESPTETIVAREIGRHEAALDHVTVDELAVREVNVLSCLFTLAERRVGRKRYAFA